MEKESYSNWNHLVENVITIYTITGKMKKIAARQLGDRLRAESVSLIASINGLPPPCRGPLDGTRIYPILSTISVMETYVQMGKRQKLFRHAHLLEEELKKIKTIFYSQIDG